MMYRIEYMVQNLLRRWSKAECVPLLPSQLDGPHYNAVTPAPNSRVLPWQPARESVPSVADSAPVFSSDSGARRWST
jgi:hypothetical protein